MDNDAAGDIARGARSTCNLSILKLHFFLRYGSISTIRPFSGMHAESLNISPAYFGFTSVIMFFFSIPFKMVLGVIADHGHNLYVLVLLVIVTEGSSNFYLGHAKPVEVQYFALTTNQTSNHAERVFCFPHSYNLSYDLPCRLVCGCQQDLLHQPSVNVPLNATYVRSIQGVCMTPSKLALVNQEHACEDPSNYSCALYCPPESDIIHYANFWKYLLARTISGAATTTSIALTDGMTYIILGSSDIELYSHQIMFGALGYGCLGALAGVLNHFAKNEGESNLAPSFYINVSLTLLDLLTLYYIEIPWEISNRRVGKDLHNLIRAPGMSVILFTLFMLGFLTSVCTFYGFLYMIELEAPLWAMGTTLACRYAAGELFSFYAAGWLQQRFGLSSILDVVLALTALRCLTYRVAENVWHIGVVEVVYGMWYGVFYAAVSSRSASVASPDIPCSTQCVLGTFFESLGLGVGSLMSGVCFERIGARSTYALFLMISVLCVVIHAVIERTSSRHICTPKRYMARRRSSVTFKSFNVTQTSTRRDVGDATTMPSTVTNKQLLPTPSSQTTIPPGGCAPNPTLCDGNDTIMSFEKNTRSLTLQHTAPLSESTAERAYEAFSELEQQLSLANLKADQKVSQGGKSPSDEPRLSSASAADGARSKGQTSPVVPEPEAAEVVEAGDAVEDAQDQPPQPDDVPMKGKSRKKKKKAKKDLPGKGRRKKGKKIDAKEVKGEDRDQPSVDQVTGTESALPAAKDTISGMLVLTGQGVIDKDKLQQEDSAVLSGAGSPVMSMDTSETPKPELKDEKGGRKEKK
ncbi:uncharacterized protein LOC135396180 isoform X2 [Ornithodoros turicata]|uniref:uncharacterized protein LOC135396180 isoform X2 n=1 Tax=Ornithodoros turicata TaxID=34597 RepID=UPI0031390BF0